MSIIFLLIIPLLLGGWTKKKKKDKKPKKDKTEQVETVAEKGDPWLVDLRAPYMKYTGVILFHYTGPEGQTATWPKHSLLLTESDAKKIKAGNYTIAVCWHSLEGAREKSMRQGILDASEQYGLKIVKETDAKNDPGKQASLVESLVAEKPDAIIAYPVDVATSASTFKKAADAGIKLAFISDHPRGLIHGQDYVGIIAPNNNDRALTAANFVAELISKDTKIALIDLDTDLWDIRFTDDLVRDTIKGRYPGIKILADEKFKKPEEAGTVAAGVIERFPDIEGIYTSNALSAVPIASALQKAGRSDIKIITTNLSEEALINMAKVGNIIGTNADTTYYIGVDAVILACFGILGKEGPEFAVSPVMPVTKDKIRDAWSLTKRIPMSAELEKALQAAGL
jgi:ribose transport system substrate-binding protein